MFQPTIQLWLVTIVDFEDLTYIRFSYCTIFLDSRQRNLLQDFMRIIWTDRVARQRTRSSFVFDNSRVLKRNVMRCLRSYKADGNCNLVQQLQTDVIDV